MLCFTMDLESIGPRTMANASVTVTPNNFFLLSCLCQPFCNCDGKTTNTLSNYEKHNLSQLKTLQRLSASLKSTPTPPAACIRLHISGRFYNSPRTTYDVVFASVYHLLIKKLLWAYHRAKQGKVGIPSLDRGESRWSQ